MNLDLTGIAVRLRGSISDGWSGDAAAADATNAEEAAAALIECRDEIARLNRDHDTLFAERGRLRLALFEARPYVPEHHGPVQARIAEALGPI